MVTQLSNNKLSRNTPSQTERQTPPPLLSLQYHPVSSSCCWDTVSNIVPQRVTSKASHFAHIPLMLTASRLLLLGPNLGPLLGLLLALSHKSKITLITIHTLLLTRGSGTNSKLLLHKVIAEPLPTRHMLSRHDALHKTLPRFGKAI
jgi:hypothetical protein